jgi:hypothetical protein
MAKKYRYVQIATTWWLLGGFAFMAAGESYREDSWNRASLRDFEGASDVLLAAVFGDGNADNGVEDDRIVQSSPGWHNAALQPWVMSAGTIHCDGEMRGSATILNVDEFTVAISGLVLATSAHVLVNLETGLPFEECSFHYLGLGNLPGYRGRIDLVRTVQGAFDASQPRHRHEFGVRDWAFLHVPDHMSGVPSSGRVRVRPFAALNDGESGREVKFRMLAYGTAHKRIGVSTECRVVESRPGDIGGGAWQGQLLDDCDSGDGASGGGLIADRDGDHFLVGIRTGSHWDESTYPAREFPRGPPAGSRWDVRLNTNFSRAIDKELISALRGLLQRIGKDVQGQQVY